jgi:hypothetical protein
MMELAANGTNYVGFKSPDAMSANKIWVLPTGDGTSGQYLKTDGAGNLSWGTDANTTYSAGTGINVTGTTITNTSPDQTVTLTGGGTTSITGAYPNFTITSTGGSTYTAGTGINITGSVITNTGDTNAADDLTTTSIFSGDLSGTSSAISVNKIRGVTVSSPHQPMERS